MTQHFNLMLMIEQPKICSIAMGLESGKHFDAGSAADDDVDDDSF